MAEIFSQAIVILNRQNIFLGLLYINTFIDTFLNRKNILLKTQKFFGNFRINRKESFFTKIELILFSLCLGVGLKQIFKARYVDVSIRFVFNGCCY